ncbi:hypothetical protein A2291_03550 [candidate division WOR-1 bacterium RIFOXYB2_FULL_42_35]|uniref:Response regulatory domain-containing protein n=1 Tax=candidate division WOR-1 bacterium RIFOXYC2_FULL_41_25 TaxID=1802586 RepID=A0A1F4TQJ0_UNCSA|nr:MAG: hypothetical protein A2247_03120 [candidate division WOR-1 bacterium RIFOXYA2_FULL_41_14]OGC25539.1 MAG: hypothetical protein A2291_03550 [candidate division WOR-1 bacterium RIFOXYB2_FULL_42_35]OGC34971.1 MAG: hypothetical protein A2462_05180 [candidate division WOR-1 bacterium RIFOXYC2_FULL_41_25]
MIVRPLKNAWKMLMTADSPVFRAGDRITRALIGDHRDSGPGHAVAVQGAHGTLMSVPPQVAQTLDSLRPVLAAAAVGEGAGTAESKGTILFVEDQGSFRSVGKVLLGRKKYTILEATSRQEAIGFLRDPSNKIDILVTDIKMGEDDAGVKLIGEAREINPELIVVVLTGYPQNEPEVMAAGADRYFTKPGNFAEIGRAIDSLVEAQEARKELAPTIWEKFGAFLSTMTSKINDPGVLDRLQRLNEQVGEITNPPAPLYPIRFDVVQALWTLKAGNPDASFSAAEESVFVTLDRKHFFKSILYSIHIARKAVENMGEEANISVALTQEDGDIVVRITDNSRRDKALSLEGIKDDLLQHDRIDLYDDYIALTLVKQYVEAQNGTVEVKNSGPTGTTLIIKYPWLSARLT